MNLYRYLINAFGLDRIFSKIGNQFWNKFSEGNYFVVIEWVEDDVKFIEGINLLKDLWLWLKEANDLLTWNNFPKEVISGISRIDAEKIKEKLENAGIKVKINSKW